ncbi:MAG: DNA translocase FtsK [Lachnospiraceae bacterium]|nr:DNA translocase FtsK [Lachnospiraceae bacterium]
MLVLFLAGLVLTFGKALLTAVGLKGNAVAHAIKDENVRRREAEEERRKLAELRTEERLLRRAQAREEKAAKEEAERKALMAQLDKKLAEGRRNFPSDTDLQLKEVRLKRQELDDQAEKRRAEREAARKQEEEKRGVDFRKTDLKTPALPADASLEELFREMDQRKKTGPDKTTGVNRENRTLEELSELEEKRQAPRISRYQDSAPVRGEQLSLPLSDGTETHLEPEKPDSSTAVAGAFDEYDRSKKTGENRPEGTVPSSPRIRFDRKQETPAARETAAGTASDGSDGEAGWVDPRVQLERIKNDDIFRKDGEPGGTGSSGRTFTGTGTGVRPKTAAGAAIGAAAGTSAGATAAGTAAGTASSGSAASAALLTPAKKEYRLPSPNLLNRSRNNSAMKEGDLKRTARLLEDTLRNFGVEVTVTDISCGPSVTRYELKPEQGVKVARISSLADDIKLALAATEIRIEAPIPGKSAVGIEVPNSENQTVSLRSIIESDEFRRSPSKIAFAVGQDIGGRVVVADLAKMPHLLIAGATGSGKSVCINSLITSILYRAKPNEVQLIMIDPKVVELGEYNGIPHLRIPVVTDPKLAAEALNGAVKEMTSRYKAFADLNVRDIKSYNAKIRENPEDYGDREPMPQIVIIVDEFADLMMVAPGDVEQSVCRLAQLARAAGIHLVVATQRPSVNVITGLIKANIQSRIALAVSSGVDSRTIIDMNGAEKLLGKGDMLFYPTGYPKPVRVQGCWVSDEEIEAVTAFWKKQNAVSEEEMAQQKLSWMAEGDGKDKAFHEERDDLFMEAAEYIIENEKASIGNLQRVFRIGFNRAARLMDQLADAGIVGKDDGTKARQIMMDRAQFEAWKQANS